jgi:uncharacterized protein (TIGR02996 family)
MIDRGSFLQAMIATSDDAPRLVYADWLEENGQGEAATRGEWQESPQGLAIFIRTK